MSTYDRVVAADENASLAPAVRARLATEMADPTSDVGASLSGTFAPKRRSRGRLVFIFDDEYASHHTIAAPLFEAYGGRCGFAVTSNLIGAVGRFTAVQMENLYRRGHSIVCHSKTHIDMTTASVATRTAEWDDSKRIIGGYLPTTWDPSWVYPLSSRNATTDSEGYLRFKRLFTGVLSTYVFPSSQRIPQVIGRYPWVSGTPADFLTMLQSAHDNDETLIAYHHDITGTDEADLTAMLEFAVSLGIDIISPDQLDDPVLVATNPGFELGVTGWTLGESGVAGVGTISSVADTPPAGMTGTNSLKVSTDTNGHHAWAESDKIRVRGQGFPDYAATVTASARQRVNVTAGTGGASMALVEYSNTGAEIALTGSGYYAGTTYAQGLITVTLNAATVDIAIRCRAINMQGDVWFDHVHFAPTAEGILG